MAREKFFKLRLSDKEFERLETEAARRELTMSQLFRELLKTLDKDTQEAQKV